jgi:FkbM family methyltransferase
MKKSLINKYCRKFGFEIHGTGFMQSIQKTSFKEDAFLKQQKIINGSVNVIFDIGANRGEVCLLYQATFPEAVIYAFEPFPESYNILIAGFKDNKNIIPYQKAIGDKPCKKTFFVNYNADTNSLLEPQKTGLSSDKQVENKNEIEVEVWTIDDFCYKNGIKKIDILKLDIQGGELAALKGAEKMLKEKSVKLIYTEAYFVQQYVDQPLLYDIANYLKQFDYHIQDIYSPIYGKGSLAWCDAIFLPA